MFTPSSFAISEHEPRKGTETIRYMVIHTIFANFRTRTPKGDGNNPSLGTPLHNAEHISEHEPRKGTETLLTIAALAASADFRTRTPKGDGNFDK